MATSTYSGNQIIITLTPTDKRVIDWAISIFGSTVLDTFMNTWLASRNAARLAKLADDRKAAYEALTPAKKLEVDTILGVSGS